MPKENLRSVSSAREGNIPLGNHTPNIPTGDPGSLFVSRTGFITWVNIENIWGEVVYILCTKDEGDYFSRNFVCILRTTTTRHMVSFIDFYFHFLANF